jgi:hypothetical protein
MANAQNQTRKACLYMRLLTATALFLLCVLSVFELGYSVPFVLSIVIVPVCLSLLVWIGYSKGLGRSKVWLYGAAVGLKLAIVFTIGPHLAILPSSEFFSSWLFWNSAFLVLALLWVASDCQSLTMKRIVSLSALTIVCQLADDYLGNHNIEDPFRPYGFDFGMWGDYRTEAISHYFFEFLSVSFKDIRVPLVGGLGVALATWFVVKPKSDDSNRTTRLYLSSKELLWSYPLNFPAIIFGAVVVLILIGLFSADNSAVGRGFVSGATIMNEGHPVTRPLANGQNRLLYHLLQFDFEALKSALSGILKSAPFIAIGCGLAWLASKFRLTGLLPILAIGALCGLGWHIAYPNHGYWTPFMTTTQSAMLIGMIAACAFGAVAQLVPNRANEGDVVASVVE